MPPQHESTDAGAILTVDNLHVQISHSAVLSGVSLKLRRGEFLGIVGESGAGKSMTAKAIVRLLPRHAKVTGNVFFNSKSVYAMPRRELQAFRGQGVAYVFQDALASLDPVVTVGAQLKEVISKQRPEWRPGQIYQRSLGLLADAQIRDPATCAESYPHQLSGGQLQRVAIAIALAGEPQVLIADEATSALDVTLQYKMLRLLAALCEKRNTSVLLITHDLGLIAEVCDRAIVLYGGTVVEECNVYDLFSKPLHPYTKALIQAAPKRGQPLKAIDGQPESITYPLTECPFAPRCEFAKAECRQSVPPRRIFSRNHAVNCIRVCEVNDGICN